MEFDLARFRGLTNADQFVATLEQACELAMTDDFWSIALPNDLATSSPRSPSLFAYNAALVLLDARALFSKLKIDECEIQRVEARKGKNEKNARPPKWGPQKMVSDAGIGGVAGFGTEPPDFPRRTGFGAVPGSGVSF